METSSTLLALCAGNSPVTGEFPAQRPVTRSFDVSCLNTRLCKQSWGWWFGTPSRSLWRHRNAEYAVLSACMPRCTWWSYPLLTTPCSVINLFYRPTKFEKKIYTSSFCHERYSVLRVAVVTSDTTVQGLQSFRKLLSSLKRILLIHPSMTPWWY